MTLRGSSKPQADHRFIQDMSCCKSARRAAELVCARPYQLCCAWSHVCQLASAGSGDQALCVLQAFAARLLGECAWPLQQVFWVFHAAGQMSALALVCADRYGAIPAGNERAAYRAIVAAATSVAFLSTFEVLCKAAVARP